MTRKESTKLRPCRIPRGHRRAQRMRTARPECRRWCPRRPSPGQTRQRHAYLGHGKQPSGIGQKVERRLRAGIAFLRHLAQARMPHREQRHFRAREKAVDGDEQNDEQKTNGRFGHRLRNYSIGNSNQIARGSSYIGNQLTPLRRWALSKVSREGAHFFCCPLYSGKPRMQAAQSPEFTFRRLLRNGLSLRFNASSMTQSLRRTRG